MNSTLTTDKPAFPLKADKTLIIYHQVKLGTDCPDGLASMHIARNALQAVGIEADILPHSYGEEPPTVEGYGKIYILDYSFKRDILQEWRDQGIKLIILDHHKTALNDLSNFEGAIFNMNKSGATLTWEYFHPQFPCPAYYQYVEDRDLWNWKLSFAEEIHEAISHERWQAKKDLPVTHHGFWLREHLNKLEIVTQEELINSYASIGAELLKPKREKIANLAAQSFAGRVAGCNAYICLIDEEDARLSSDLASKIYREKPCDFALIISKRDKEGESKGWALSFRSNKDGANFNVSEIAKLFGGGGHRNASGAFIAKPGTPFQEILQVLEGNLDWLPY